MNCECSSLFIYLRNQIWIWTFLFFWKSDPHYTYERYSYKKHASEISQAITVKLRDIALGVSDFVSIFWWAYLRGAYLRGGLSGEKENVLDTLSASG